MSKKTGRPKEEGGHKRINISINDFTNKALKKIREGKGNVSKFIENQLRPVLENLDPGEASIHVWRIEAYLSREIIKATKLNKPGLAQALASIATALKDFRALCGIPPANFVYGEEAENSNNSFLSYKKESWIVTFFTVAVISIFGFIATKELSYQAVHIISNQTSTVSTQILRTFIPAIPYVILTPVFIVIVLSVLKARNWLRTRLNLLFTSNGHS